MKINKPIRTAGFTLIEMLAVITIIVILAGMVIGGMSYVTDRQARDTARVQIALLSNALEEYKMDNGVYPQVNDTGSGEGNTTELFERLFWDTDGDSVTGNDDLDQKIYLAELDPNDTKQKWTEPSGNSYKIIDPWGNEYRYRSGTDATGARNPSAQNPDFDLWSVGKDGRTNPGPPYDPNHSDNKDDIRNF
jgi:general secretion pathway protein G